MPDKRVTPPNSDCACTAANGEEEIERIPRVVDEVAAHREQGREQEKADVKLRLLARDAPAGQREVAHDRGKDINVAFAAMGSATENAEANAAPELRSD
jgi:hypothetical protein